ncbi:MAG: hypothetical protein ACKO37_00900 [Vampirovibrionales bacterium]
MMSGNATSGRAALIPVVVFGAILGISWMLGLEGAINEATAANDRVVKTRQEVEGQQKEITELNADLANLKALRGTGANIKIGTYKENEYENKVKATMKDLINVLHQTGNTLISLRPIPEVGTGVTPAPEPSKPPEDASAGASNGDTTTPAPEGAKDGKDTANAPKKKGPKKDPKEAFKKELKKFQTIAQVRTLSYRVAFRGDYANILSFVQKLTEWPELLRVNDVKFFNQLSSIRVKVVYKNKEIVDSSNDDDITPDSQEFIDNKRPVVMQATITLYLVEESLANQYADVEEGALDDASASSEGEAPPSGSGGSDAATPPA